MLTSWTCTYLKDILGTKVFRRGKGTRRFFGEAYVTTQIAHADGYYGSFQWLTNSIFLGSRPFPKGSTQEFQQQYRSALQRQFCDQLKRLQQNAKRLEEATGVRPAAPDLWLIDMSGRHRFIEIKLPKDEVSDSQIAGLSVIAASLQSERGVSVEIIELNPDRKGRFAEFIQKLGTG